MMVAMMLPSVMPAVLLHQRLIDERASSRGERSRGSQLLLLAGYFSIWVAFGALAYAAGMALAAAAMRSVRVSVLIPAATGAGAGGRRSVSTDAVEADLPSALPLAAGVLRAARDPPGRRFVALRASSWRVLRRVLLGTDGHPARARRDERAADGAGRARHPAREAVAPRRVAGALRRRDLARRGHCFWCFALQFAHEQRHPGAWSPTRPTTCNCAWGCPCQFNALPTHGRCEAMVAVRIREGHYGTDEARRRHIRRRVLVAGRRARRQWHRAAGDR